MSTITHDFDNVPKKKHYSTRLKERITELERDLYKVIDGDIETINIYKTRRQFKKEQEVMMWSGSVNDKEGFNGFINNILNNDKNK